jgi:hypothetical protein
VRLADWVDGNAVLAERSELLDCTSHCNDRAFRSRRFSAMASNAQSATEEAPKLEAQTTESVPVEESKTSARSFFRLVGGHLIPCEPKMAEIIAYTSPTMDDEAELQEQ